MGRRGRCRLSGVGLDGEERVEADSMRAGSEEKSTTSSVSESKKAGLIPSCLMPF